MAARKFSRTVNAGVVRMADRTYQATIKVSAPVGAPDRLQGYVFFRDTDPRNPPKDKRNFFGEEVYADHLEYSFESIERLIEAYKGAKQSLFETSAERAAEKGVDQNQYWIEVASGVLTLFVDAGNWHWGGSYGRRPNWLTTTIEETDHVVSTLGKATRALRALPAPEALPSDIADVENDRIALEEELLKRRAERVEMAMRADYELSRRPQKAAEDYLEDENPFDE